MISKGIVVSDLHLFAKRARPEIIEELEAMLQGQDFLVLNGDIFDFAWSVHACEEETVQHSLNFLTQLCQRHPHCHVHYIMGNHDGVKGFADALSSMSESNFSWHPEYVVIGNALFLHGDLAMGSGHPFKRTLKMDVASKRPLAHGLYSMLIASRLHGYVRWVFRPRICAWLILRAIERHSPQSLDGIAHIYFGHTHVPFAGFSYRGRTFHNTGSAIKHLTSRILHAGG